MTDPLPPDDPAAAPAAGRVFAIGGALKLDHDGVWARLVQEAGGPGSRFLVFPTASEHPQRSGERVATVLRRHGAAVEVVPLAPRWPDADWRAVRDDPAWVAQVAQAQAVYFGGGSQAHITDALRREDGRPSALLAAIEQLARRGGLVAGTSAGAAVMSRWMFRDARDALSVLKGRLREGCEIDRGLGFVGPDLFIDQHFLKRGRIARLLPAMLAKGYRFGLGVEENSAAWIHDGVIEVLGERGALLVDLGQAQWDRDAPAFQLRGAALTFLDRGDRHDLRSHRTVPHADKQAGARIDPNAADFRPYFPGGAFFADMLGDNTLVHAMVQLLDSPSREVRGLAFDGAALMHGEADAFDATLGFEFRLYKGADTLGQYTGAWGGEDYSVQRVYLDVTPVRLSQPLYRSLSR